MRIRDSGLLSGCPIHPCSHIAWVGMRDQKEKLIGEHFLGVGLVLQYVVGAGLSAIMAGAAFANSAHL